MKNIQENNIYVNIIYLSLFLFAYFITYLLKNDLKVIKNNIYNLINTNIWIKIYALISIALIHLTWLFLILFYGYQDKGVIYGFPSFLLISYAIYLAIDLRDNDKNNNIVTENINKILNYLISIYFIFIIILIMIPNKNKEDFIKCLINLVNKYLVNDE